MCLDVLIPETRSERVVEDRLAFDFPFEYQ